MSYNYKMQISFLVLLVTIFTVVYGKPATQGPTSTTSRPEISDEAIEATLKDKRYLQRQLKCAVGEAPCDPVGKRLKSLVPLVIHGSCPCTPKEQQQIKKILAYVQVNFPKEWNKILRQYTSG